MSSWRKAKGLYKAVNKCPKCHGEFPDNEYSLEDDVCYYCLFPEASKGMPVPFSHKKGFSENITNERELLDNLEYIPEKQSKQAKKSYKEYKKRNIYK